MSNKSKNVTKEKESTKTTKTELSYCQYFGCVVPKKDLEEHERRCGNKIIKHEACNSSVYARCMDAHKRVCLINVPERNINEENVISQIDDYDEQIQRAIDMSFQPEND